MGISLRKNKVGSSDKPTVDVVVTKDVKKGSAAPVKRQEFAQQYPSCADLKRAAAAANSVSKEIIHIQIGQAGNQIGAKFWEMLGKDHGIDFDGQFYGYSEAQLHHVRSYYNNLSDGRYVPRAVAVDLESGSMKFFRASKVGRSFNPENVINGETTTENCWATGYNHSTAVDSTVDIIRREAERSDWLQGFQFVHSLAGGTGSGFCGLLMERLRDEYPDRIQMTFSLFPSACVSHVIVEQYNTILSLNQLLKVSDATFYFDNEKLFETSSYTGGLDIQKQNKTFSGANNIIASNILGATTQFRFSDQLNGDFRKFTNTMIPVKGLQILTSSFSPMVSEEAASYRTATVPELALQLSQPSSQTSYCRLDRGQYLSAAAVFRGQVSVELADDEMMKMRHRSYGNFVNCCRDNIVTSVCPLQQPGHKMCATLICNNTSVHEPISYISSQFEMMFRRRAFIHRYTGEGMVEEEFSEAYSNIEDLIEQYKRLERGVPWRDISSTWKYHPGVQDLAADESRISKSSQG